MANRKLPREGPVNVSDLSVNNDLFAIKKMEWYAMLRMRSTLVALLVSLLLTFPLSASPGFSESSEKTSVRVLLITMFDRETAPWIENESLTKDIQINGMEKPLHCNNKKLCVATIGVGKSNAATSMTAILQSKRLDFSNAYFISSGIGGTPPDNGTLGFASWANWVVDWDLGHHLLPESAPEIPHGYLPGKDIGTNVFKLSSDLVETAYGLTKDLPLEDSKSAEEARSHYPGQLRKDPYVAKCDTITGDNYWAGEQLSERADYIMRIKTDGKGSYCSTQMEDSAIATALRRHGHLERYLSLRVASNFDQPYEGQSIKELLSSYPGFLPAVNNAYLVGSTVAHYLLWEK